MPIYVVVAYAIFCAVPLGLGIVTALRHRQVQREIEMLEAERRSRGPGRVVRRLGGSPCSGKSSIAELLVVRNGVRVYHVDEALRDYSRRISPERHP